MRTVRLAALFVAVVLASCGKAPPPPGPVTGGGETWGPAPTGPFWEALGRVPSAAHGTAGYLVPSAARAAHPAWSEAGHERWMAKVDTIFVQRLGIPAEDLTELLWAELQPEDGGAWSFACVHLKTPEQQVCDALTKEGFGPSEEGLWVRGSDKGKFLVGGGWVTFLSGGEAQAAALHRTMRDPSMSLQSSAHVAALVAGLGGNLPASVTFGIGESPAPGVEAKVVAAALAPDAQAGEIRVMAFDSAAGPEAMLGSDAWKRSVAATKDPPKAVVKGPYLKLVSSAVSAAAAQDRARETKTKAEIKSLEMCAQLFKMDNGKFPVSMDDLQGYYGGTGLDAWGHPIRYKLLQGQEKPFEFRSPGPDGKDGTADDIVGSN